MHSFVVIVLVGVLTAIVMTLLPSPAPAPVIVTGNELTMIVVGDSYSAGTGATQEESWPALLAEDLTHEGIPTVLVANPSVAGYTTQNAIEKELPLLPDTADIAFLLLGANDWFQQTSSLSFRENMHFLIHDLQERAPHVFVITIPDYSVAPKGFIFLGSGDVKKGIEAFNQIIREEAADHDIPVIDIVPVSRSFTPDLYADGLHPNANGYSIWEQEILSQVLPFLRLA